MARRRQACVRVTHCCPPGPGAGSGKQQGLQSGRAWWRLTRGWARSSPAHPRGSPRWAASPPGPGRHSAWASLWSVVRLYPPAGCYSPGRRSGYSEPLAAVGWSWPHLGRRKGKSCSALSPAGTQGWQGGLEQQGGPPSPVLPAGKPGGLCCTAFNSSSRRSSSERLLPKEALMTVGEGSADFCLLGKLQEAKGRLR